MCVTRWRLGVSRGAWPQLDPLKKLIVVTAHRRESFGEGFTHICEALARLALQDDIQLVYPVHRNPHVMDPVYQQLDGLANVFLVEPLGYVPFVDLMRRAYLLITDSGGIQEEGPSLGKPILVMRKKLSGPKRWPRHGEIGGYRCGPHRARGRAPAGR